MTPPLPSKVGANTAGVGVETCEANERELGRKPNEQSVQSSDGRDRKNLGVFLVWEIQGLSSSGQKLCLFKGKSCLI